MGISLGGDCDDGDPSINPSDGEALNTYHEEGISDGTGDEDPIIETPGGAAYFFEIAPNPATASVNVHLHGHAAGAHLYIRDQFGRLLWNQQLDAAESMFTIPLEGNRFVSGTYYVTVFNNGESITKRLAVVK